MNYLLYGEDTYRSRKKLHEIISAYQTRAGSALNIYGFDAEDGDIHELKGIAVTNTLFAAKKLIVVENIFLRPDALEFLHTVLASTKEDSDTIVFLWAGAVERKQAKALAALEKNMDKVQEFKPFARPQLKRWIEREAAARAVTLKSHELEELVGVGDLWTVSNALEKFAVGGTVEGEYVKSTVPTVFQLGDVFFQSPSAALRTLNELLAGGHDEFGIFVYLTNHVRTLLLIKDQIERGQPVPKNWEIHPFVVKKATALAGRVQRDVLINILHQFFEEDHLVKIGLATPKESLRRILITRSV